MSIELRHLRKFRVLAEELNFTRASRRTNTSQSALSEQIMRLEDVLGVRLFERSKRFVKLTVAGEALKRELPDLLDRVDSIVARTRSAGSDVRPRLRIGYSAMSLNTPMAAILHKFRAAHSEVEVVLQEQSSSGTENALLDFSLDCVFAPNPPDNPTLGQIDITHDPILCCVPADHPLAKRESVSVKDLKGEPLILPNTGSRYAAFILGLFSQYDVEPKIVARSSRPTVFLTMVSAGLGITFMPTCFKGMVTDGIALRPFGMPHYRVPFSLVWNQEKATPHLHLLTQIARYSADPVRDDPADASA